MNPVEKVKAILDGLTLPLSEDSPFNSKGRDVSFNNNNQEMGNLSFQAFFGRINTFEPEYWGSDPNAAMFLAKYGFKIVSRYKMLCVSCLFELDFEIFLTLERAVVHTLAIYCHKKNCRWRCISTPKEYFEIPRNPRRILQDMKVTFTELVELESDLPVVRKESWLQMGITEDFVQTLLDFFDFPINDIFSASCVVLTLCGWIKKSDTTLQCKFCRRVLDGNNFFTKEDNYRKKLVPDEHSRVVSLLYNEIKRNLDIKKTVGESSGDRIHEKRNCKNASETVMVPENRKTGTYSLSTGCSEFEKHLPYSKMISKDNNIGTGLKVLKDEETQMREISSVMQAQEIKKKAFRFLWNDSRRWREKYPFKVFRLNRETESKGLPRCTEPFEELSSPIVLHEDSTRLMELHEVSQMPPRQSAIIGGIVTETIFIDENEWLVPCKIADDDPHYKASAHDQEITVKSHDKNFQFMLPEKCIPECNLSSAVTGELKSGLTGAPFQMCHSQTSCDCEVCATKIYLNRNSDSCNNNTLNHSGKSCNNSEVNNSETSGNSGSRRKRKRVPENEQNGTPNSSDVQVLQESAHFRSKKKVFDLMHNEPANLIRSKKRKFEDNASCEEHISGPCILSSKRDVAQSLNENGQDADFLSVEQNNATCKEYSSVTCAEYSKSVQERRMLKSYVEEEGRNLMNGYGAYQQYSDASESQQDDDQYDDYGEYDEDSAYEEDGMYEEDREYDDNGEYDDSEKVLSEETIAISSTQSSVTGDREDDEHAEKKASGNTTVISSSLSSGEEEDENGVLVKKKTSVVGDVGGDDSKNIISECAVVLLNESSRVSERDVCDSEKSSSENARDTSAVNSSAVREEDESEKMICESEEMISSPLTNVEIEDAVNSQYSLRTSSCKRKRNKSEDSVASDRLPNLEKYQSEICRSYVHPELEHRFWCIWRISFSDDPKTSNGERKGWEHYADNIQKALELHKTEKQSVLEMEKLALNNLTKILNLTRQRKSKDASS